MQKVPLMSESFSRRMRAYEKTFLSQARTDQPCILRLDGRAFHRFTQGLPDPFDARLAQLMQATTAYLVEITHAVCGYTQSDEISLVLWARKPGEQLYFGGKIHKLISVTAAEATLYFHQAKQTLDLPEKQLHYPVHFDCRFLQVPTATEAVNYLRWREQEAQRNSVAQLARQHFDRKSLLHKNTAELKNLLRQHRTPWETLSEHAQRGTFFQTQITEVSFEPTQTSLPPKHHGHTQKSYFRRQVQALDIKDLQHLEDPESFFFS